MPAEFAAIAGKAPPGSVGSAVATVPSEPRDFTRISWRVLGPDHAANTSPSGSATAPSDWGTYDESPGSNSKGSPNVPPWARTAALIRGEATQNATVRR